MFAQLAFRVGIRVFFPALALAFIPGTPKVAMAQASGGSSVRSRPIRSAEPPRITTDLPRGATIFVGQELRFGVTVTDRERDRVTLRLLNPEPGMVFHPVQDGPSGTTSEVRWFVGVNSGGLSELLFEAHDDTAPERRTRLRVELRIVGSSRHQALLEGDVTGDGVLDVIVGYPFAEVDGMPSAGAIHVFAGGRNLSGPVSPSATLAVPGAAEADRLGLMPNLTQGIRLGDVTGDGVLDVVALTPDADIGGEHDAGAVYVFRGGRGLSGLVSPKATLTVPENGAFTFLPFGSGTTLQLVDVTGDGVSDVVATGEYADPGGIPDSGAVYVFAGGARLSGSVAPKATLSVAEAAPGDGLGGGGFGGQGVIIADVTGDGVPDVVAMAPRAGYCDSPNTGENICDAGAIYVFRGGRGLSGSVAPTAKLSVPEASDEDLLGYAEVSGVQLADVTGDGSLDVVAGAILADGGGVEDTGAIYVFAGSEGLSGAVSPSATLSVPGAVAKDWLGYGEDTRGGIRLADVSGDGVLDVVAGAVVADIGGVPDTGAVYTFLGGSGISGPVAPSATLSVPGATAGARLGKITVADLNGDGFLDIVTGSRLADAGGIVDSGAIYLFAGGPLLLGASPPTATLRVPDAVEGDGLGDVGLISYELVDVTADGVVDVVAGASRADVDGTADAGAIYLFNGGGELSGESFPAARLSVPGASASDRLGNFLVADVTGEGSLDIVASARFAQVEGEPSAGEIYVFSGSSGFSGMVAPAATLSAPAPSPHDSLDLWQVADVTADGTLDVVAGTPQADIDGVTDVGAIFVFEGGAGLSGSVPPAVLSVPGAAASDGLGEFFPGHGVRLADVTGDGKLDILGGAVRARSVYAWSGPVTASSAPTATLSFPHAVPAHPVSSEAQRALPAPGR